MHCENLNEYNISDLGTKSVSCFIITTKMLLKETTMSVLI